MKRGIITCLILLAMQFVSCGGHNHGDHSSTSAADSICARISDYRYKDSRALHTLAVALDNVAPECNESVMISGNAKAYSALMRMDYATAADIYNTVIKDSRCEIERLVADVGLMTICYRVSDNRLFFDHRARALERMKRISEELGYLSDSDKERFRRAEVEFAIVSVCYFSNLAMRDDMMRSLSYLRSFDNKIKAPSLNAYAKMLLANNEPTAEVRLEALAEGLDFSMENGYTWLQANYKLLLAILLRDRNDLTAALPAGLAVNAAEKTSPKDLPLSFATDAAKDFDVYGDIYMMIEALAVSASCCTQQGNYNEALDLLDVALERINTYYTVYYPDSTHYASNVLYDYDFEAVPNMASGAGMYNIPECLLSVRREASCAFAGLGDKYASDINREDYLQLLRSTRLNKQMESSASSAEANITLYGNWMAVVVVVVVLLMVSAVMLNRRRRRYVKAYSGDLKRLPVVCRQLLSSLPQEVSCKEELLAHISSLLNDSFRGFSGDVEFHLCPAGEVEAGYTCCFELKYLGSSATDVLCVKATRPLTPEKLSLLEMLVPYVAVAVEEGMRLSDISDEQERLEEMRQAYMAYLAEHKRENLLKRVSVSVVMSMRPFMDRIINELRALPGAATDTDANRKLHYVEELTERLDELNVILERWIKMRHGEMSLQVESFALAELFDIISKSRQLLEARGITLNVGDGNAVVKADKALTLFMINTLVDNASKFTPRGGNVTVECLQGNDYVEVAVSDSGIGLSESDINRILTEKVYDASDIGGDNELLPAKNKGGGFGLMNCKGIIEKYKKTDALFSVCSFDIKSRKGVGSRFSFRLPKGILRSILVIFMMLPCASQANDALFEEIRFCADSVYSSNANGNHDEAFVQAGKAIGLLNRYYRETICGFDTISLSGNGAAELKWWRDGLFDASLTDDIFYNILDIRNELAVASLAQQKWSQYRYNNYIYSTLYRLVHEDQGVAGKYEQAREMLGQRQALLAISCFLLLVLVIYLVVFYLRHSVIGKVNERMVQETNLRLLELVSRASHGKPQLLLQGVADEIYASLGERMRMERVALLLKAGEQGGAIAAASPQSLDGGRADVYLHGVADDGEPYTSPDALIRVLPLRAAVSGNEVFVGALEVVTGRPLGDNEAVSLELVASFVASVIYHSTVRVAGSYTTLEEVEEETERIRYEENRLHVQNMVMDNCLSVIKHETVYYPSRVQELARKALADTDGRSANITAMSELMEYYNSVFGILSNCAKRELDTMCFTLSTVPVEQLFADAASYLKRRAAKRGVALELGYEPTSLTVRVDADLQMFLFESLIDAALAVPVAGKLLLRATDAGDMVKVELVDNRRTLQADEVAELFTPSRYNLGPQGDLQGMEYLIAKEIVRMHEDYTGRHGSRMEARSDVVGTVIMFTLPK